MENQTDKQAYYSYRDSISNTYLEDYITNHRGGNLKANISCIYATTEPAHKKGTDNKPSMGYDKKIKKYHCLTCNKLASLYDIVKYDNNFTTDTEVYNYLKTLYPDIKPFNKDTLVQNSTDNQLNNANNYDLEIDTSYNFTNFVNESNKKVLDSANYLTKNGIDSKYMVSHVGLKYYKSRGLTEDTIKRFKLATADNGFNDLISEYPALKSKSNKQHLYKYVLPILDSQGNCYNFITEIANRKEIDTYNSKYKKPTGLTSQIFNEYYLKDNTPKTIFITEGIYDALSIEQLGYNAIALMGVGQTRLLNIIKQYRPALNIIMMLDNDTAGKSATKTILNMLNTLSMENIKYIDSMDIIKKYNLEQYKDANQMLNEDLEHLKAFLQENYNIINTTEDTERIDNANISNNLDYFRTIEQQPPIKLVSTGFSMLDKYLKGGIRTGLYILGAVSNLGKTAFLLQIADQIAKQGIPVLYFSLEMDKKELMARSIARTTYIQVNDKTDSNNKPIASDTFDILDNTMYENYSKDKKDVINTSINIYENIAKNLYIMSGRFKQGKTSNRMTIDNIEQIIKDFKQYKGIVPIVFIDYMQIIAPTDKRLTDKQSMDEIVDRLKQISIDLDTPVIAISSYNRDNYYEPANIGAFKESGSIEYGADYVLALQYKGIDEIYYDNNSKKTEQQKKRDIYELIEQIKENSRKGEPVPIVLKVLKSRNSSKFNMSFKFKANYGYFREDITNNTDYRKSKYANATAL